MSPVSRYRTDSDDGSYIAVRDVDIHLYRDGFKNQGLPRLSDAAVHASNFHSLPFLAIVDRRNGSHLRACRNLDLLRAHAAHGNFCSLSKLFWLDDTTGARPGHCLGARRLANHADADIDSSPFSLSRFADPERPAGIAVFFVTAFFTGRVAGACRPAKNAAWPMARLGLELAIRKLDQPRGVARAKTIHHTGSSSVVV